MSIGANMFDSLNPPAIWIELKGLAHSEDDTRIVVVRIKEAGRRSISASVSVSKYSPEWSVMKAIESLFIEASVAQTSLTSAWLKASLSKMINHYVEPF